MSSSTGKSWASGWSSSAPRRPHVTRWCPALGDTMPTRTSFCFSGLSQGWAQAVRLKRSGFVWTWEVWTLLVEPKCEGSFSDDQKCLEGDGREQRDEKEFCLLMLCHIYCSLFFFFFLEGALPKSYWLTLPFLYALVGGELPIGCAEIAPIHLPNPGPPWSATELPLPVLPFLTQPLHLLLTNPFVGSVLVYISSLLVLSFNAVFCKLS